jgi:hypothetical protein
VVTDDEPRRRKRRRKNRDELRLGGIKGYRTT